MLVAFCHRSKFCCGREVSDSAQDQAAPAGGERGEDFETRSTIVTNEGPIVSVVIPCFNAETTIVDAVDSVRLQSYANWNAIVVDDGSTDSTVDAITAAVGDDPRFRIVEKSNGGVASARNVGIGCAGGKFVAFLDADDAWNRTHLAVMVEALNADLQTGLAFCRAEICDENGKTKGVVSHSHEGPISPQVLALGNPATTMSTVVGRRSAIRAVGFDEDFQSSEDLLHLLNVQRAGWIVRGVDAVGVRYRTSPHGLSADLEVMRSDWDRFIEIAASDPHNPVDCARARARNRLYLARRAVRLHHSTREVARYFCQAVRAHPAEVILAFTESVRSGAAR